MKKALIPFACICIAILILFACQKQVEVDLPSRPEPDPPSQSEPDHIVNASFVGRITDESGEPLGNVTVIAGGKTTYTDIDGIFRLTDINVSEKFGFVKAEKEGYFQGSRTVFTNAGASNFVEIQLIPRKLKGTLQSLSSATINIENGVTVAFNKTAFVTAAGAVYSGAVNVFGAFLDPASDNFSDIMPGDLRGTNADNEVTALESYGMLAIELEGASGERLQLAPDNKANISMEITPSLRASAPDSIPLWFFDEADGKWKEEGAAKKTDNVYSGEVSHFTYWNYDVPQNFVYASLTLKDQHNNNLAYTTVKITDTRNNTFGTGFSDSLGYLKVWVPKGAPLEINVINSCREILLTKNAGPFNTDATIGELQVNIPEAGSVVIKGTAVDCDNRLITNGFANVLLHGLNYRSAILDGHFTTTINRCNTAIATAQVFAGDYNSSKESGPRDIEVSNGEFNAGNFIACDNELSEYLFFDVGTNHYSLTFPGDSLAFYREGSYTSISMMKLPGGGKRTYMQFSLNDTIPHTYKQASNFYADNVFFTSQNDSITYRVTKYGKVNEFIEVNFSGQVMVDSLTTVYPFSGNLRVRRLH